MAKTQRLFQGCQAHGINTNNGILNHKRGETMTQENLEPQDEMKEVLNEEVETSEENTPNQEGGSLEEGQSSEEGGDQEGVQNEVNPEVKALADKLVREQREKDQEAVNRRIAKEVAKRKAIENQYNDFRSEFDEFKKQLTPKQEPPKLDQFESPEEFMKASYDYYDKQKVAPKQPQGNTEYTPSELEIQFSRKAEEYAKTHPEYFNTAKNLIPYTQKNPALYEAIAEAGPEVAEYLGSNMDTLDDLLDLSPARLGRAIAQIENNFKRSQPLPKKANPKPPPVSDNRGSTSTTKDISTMSQSDYNKYMASL